VISPGRISGGEGVAGNPVVEGVGDRAFVASGWVGDAAGEAVVLVGVGEVVLGVGADVIVGVGECGGVGWEMTREHCGNFGKKPLPQLK
jgi:hypothetical protein